MIFSHHTPNFKQSPSTSLSLGFDALCSAQEQAAPTEFWGLNDTPWPQNMLNFQGIRDTWCSNERFTPRHAKGQSLPSLPYLEHQHTHVGNCQVDFGALTVRGKVESDAIHLQFPGNFKHLKVRFSRSLTPIKRKKNRILTTIWFYNTANTFKSELWH